MDKKMNNNCSGSRKKILAVDDDIDFLKLLKLRLEANGYEVITAFDGEKALKKIKSKKPDMVILDIMLPKLNGEEVCRNIRNDHIISKTPVIMLTGKNTDVDRIVGRVIGADVYITKPFEAEEFIAKVKKLIG